jgi:hypothetical protein
MRSIFLSRAPKVRKACRAKGKEKGTTKVEARAKALATHNLSTAIDVRCHIMVPLARCASCHHVATV